MSKLLQEAIADANKVKEIAYENAKAAIEEVFQPKIQRMISTKLAEEDFEEEMPPEMMEPEMEPEEDEYAMGENYIDDGKNGTPDNPLKNNGYPQTGLDEVEIDEEFDKIIRELENSDNLKEAEDAAYEDTVSASKKNIGEGEFPEGGEEGCADEPAPEEDDLEDLNLESLIRKLEEEEFGKAKAAPRNSSPKPSGEVASLRAENVRLKKENREAFKVIAEMKSTMNEVNLLNSKLMFSSKIIQSYDLSEAQQVNILETFDRAQSVREVKLIYATIHEHYKGRTVKNSRPSPKTIAESASRTIKTVKGNKPANDGLMEGAERWQIIAGLKPLND